MSKCSDHPDAPHGFNRSASHTEGRYVCDCEGWIQDDDNETNDTKGARFMIGKVTTYRGKPIEECTKEELLEVIDTLDVLLRASRELNRDTARVISTRYKSKEPFQWCKPSTWL